MMRPYIRDRLAFQDRAGFKPAPTIWPCMREAGRHPTATTGREEIRSSIMQRREPGRRSMRLSGHDYSTPGAYFITACTHNRLLLFGRVVNGKMAANRLGAAVEDCWAELPEHYDNVALDAFILMPNHVHGVIIIQDAPTGVGAGLQPARPEDGPTGVGAGLQRAPALKTHPRLWSRDGAACLKSCAHSRRSQLAKSMRCAHRPAYLYGNAVSTTT